MKKGIRLLCLLLAVCMLGGCAVPPPADQEPTSTQGGAKTGGDAMTQLAVEPRQISFNLDSPRNQDISAVINRMNQFSLEIWSRVAQEEDDYIFSPFSVYLALACLSGGTVGETYEELRAVLYPEGMSREDFNTAVGNLIDLLTADLGEDHAIIDIAGLICTRNDYRISMEFAQAAQDYYASDAASVDFGDPATIDAMNKWVEEATRGLVKEPFKEDFDPSTVMVLMNSLYFEAKWAWPFTEDATSVQTFHGRDGDTTVEMMVRESPLAYYKTKDLQFARQHYTGGAYMDIFLPERNTDTKAVLPLVAQMDERWLSSEENVLLKMPKYEMQTDIGLNEILEAMGMPSMFGGGLDNLVEEGGGGLFVSLVRQCAKIEVDEKGTKAAAVTIVAIAESVPPEPVRMTVDRPYLYKIGLPVGDYGELILFVGEINNL
ncbi:MAG: serpin family protein [Christensenellales bacterium]